MPNIESAAHHASTSLADDLLVGADAIAKFTGWSTRRIFYLNERGELPAFKVGGRLHARKSTLLNWVRSMEKSAENRSQVVGKAFKPGC